MITLRTSARLLTCTLSLVLSLLVLAGPAPAAWVPFGGASPFVTATSTGSGIADVTEGPSPLVAWIDQDGSNARARVAQLNTSGNGWSPLPPPTTSNAVKSLAIARSASGPVVVWTEGSTGNPTMFVARFNGTSWLQLGPTPPTDGTGASPAPRIAVAGGRPVVLWHQLADIFDDAGDLYLSVFDEGTNTWASTVIDPGHCQFGCDEALVGDGSRGYVAWNTAAGILTKQITSVTPLTLTQLGAATRRLPSGTGFIDSPDLAVAPDGVALAWRESNKAVPSAPGTLHQFADVASWNGTSWTSHQSPSDGLWQGTATEMSAFTPSVSLVCGAPALAWKQEYLATGADGSAMTGVYTARMQGSTWTGVARFHRDGLGDDVWGWPSLTSVNGTSSMVLTAQTSPSAMSSHTDDTACPSAPAPVTVIPTPLGATSATGAVSAKTLKPKFRKARKGKKLVARFGAKSIRDLLKTTAKPHWRFVVSKSKTNETGFSAVLKKKGKYYYLTSKRKLSFSFRRSMDLRVEALDPGGAVVASGS